MIIDQLFTQPIFEDAPMASPEQIAYNQLRAQWEGYQKMTSGGGNTAVSRDPAHAAKLATVPTELARMAAALKAKGIDAEAEYEAIGGPKAAPVDANQAYGGVSEVAPPGAKAERMVRHIKQGYAKDGKLTPKEKGIAFATAWKAHNAGQVEEATDPKRDKLERMIWKYYGKIYNYGDDDGLDYLDRNGELWNQLMDKYNGEIDDIVASESTEVLMQAAQELKDIAGDMKYELDEQGVAEGEVTKNTTGLKHRATDKYGAGDDQPHHYTGGRSGFSEPGKYARDLEHVNKQLVKDLDASMGISWKNRGPKGLEVDEQGMAEGVVDTVKKIGKKLIKPVEVPGLNQMKAIHNAELKREIAAQNKKYAPKDVTETEKNPHTSALGRALYRDLSKEKKASPQQVQRNKERWAQRQAEREQGVAEAGDTAKGQKMLAKVHQRAADRVTSKQADKDPAYARKAQQTQDRAWDRLAVKEQGVAEGSVNDYFKRRKDEEDRIAGTKAPAKRTPKQTDYEKKRKEQGVAEGEIERQHGDIKPWAYWSFPERVAKKLYQIHKGQPIGKTAIVQLWKTDGPDRMTKFMFKPDVSAILSAYQQMSEQGPLFKPGVAEADKHSFIGRIQRHNELKNKVDRTWRDAVDAENKGDKSGATRAFNKHVRYTNLERPGTWRTVKDQDQDITEMDKSEPSAGRDTGPRSGPDREAKPITAKKATKDAADMLTRAVKDSHKKKDVKESDTLMLKLERALIREGRVKELADDLKTMADSDFMKKYGKAKAAIRRDMNKLDEAPINELSTNKLAQYKTAAAKDATAADKAGDVKRGDKRFGGIVKATKKQFDNDAKKVDESRAARRALMAQIVKGN